MDPLILGFVSVLIIVVAAIVYFLKFHQSQDTELAVAVPERNAGANVARGAPVAAVVQGARRRVRAPGRNRRVNQDSDDEASEGEEMFDSEVHGDDKIGAKKQRKLEEKAAKKAQREAELQEREEKKKQNEKLEKLRKTEEKKKEAEEASKAADELKEKEERDKQEHEEYLRLKREFLIEAEGEDAEEEDTTQSLQQFIAYIKESKVIMLEDLAAHFKLKIQDVIDRIKTLQEEGSLSGVIDDRGKFVYITSDEYEAVARFIKQRGRVSIAELAESMNRLIDLNPELKLKERGDASAAVSMAS